MSNKLQVRTLKKDDYEFIANWWKWWRWKVVPREMLPENGLSGLMVEKNNKPISTGYIRLADIIWVISPWTWEKLPEKVLKNRKVLVTIHHIDEKKFTLEDAIKFLKYPKKINDEITIHIGPYGYYMKHNGKNYKVNQSGKYTEEYCLGVIRK